MLGNCRLIAVREGDCRHLHLNASHILRVACAFQEFAREYDAAAAVQLECGDVPVKDVGVDQDVLEDARICPLNLVILERRDEVGADELLHWLEQRPLYSLKIRHSLEVRLWEPDLHWRPSSIVQSEF